MRRPLPASAGDSLLPLRASYLVPTWKECGVTAASAAAIDSCSCRCRRASDISRVTRKGLHHSSTWKPTCLSETPVVVVVIVVVWL